MSLQLEPVELLQTHAPRPDHHLTSGDLRDYGEDAIRPLVDQGFLVQSGRTLFAPCPACDGDHDGEVMETVTPTGPIFSLACPDAGLVRLHADQLLTHTIDHAAIALWAAQAMGATSAPTEPISNEVWRWDRVHLLGGRERWSLIIGRNLDRGTTVAEWQRLGLVSKAIILSMGYKAVPPPEEGPYAFSGVLWQFMDFYEGEWEFLIDDLLEGLGSHAPAKPKRPAVARSAAREQRYRQMKTFLVEQIQSAKDAIRNKALPLAPPDQQFLAKLCKVNKSTITKDLQRSDPGAGVILRLMEIAADQEEIRRFDARPFQ